MTVIIDTDTFLYCYKDSDDPLYIIHSLREWISNIFRVTGATKYLMFITSGRNSFRYKICKEYKGNRDNKVAPRWKQFIKQFLIAEYGAIELFEIEADDAVATHHYLYPDSIICSIDSDFTTIPCKLFNFKTYQFQTIDSQFANHEFWKYVLCGQAKDNIKPCHSGFGPVKAEKFLSNINNKFGDKDFDYYDAVKDVFVNGCTKELCGKDFVVEDDIVMKSYMEHCFDINYRLMKILTNKSDYMKEGLKYIEYYPLSVMEKSNNPPF